jgi:hypothetical protein
VKTTAYFDAVRVRPNRTVEHASTRADAPHFSYEEVAA